MTSKSGGFSLVRNAGSAIDAKGKKAVPVTAKMQGLPFSGRDFPILFGYSIARYFATDIDKGDLLKIIFAAQCHIENNKMGDNEGEKRGREIARICNGAIKMLAWRDMLKAVE